MASALSSSLRTTLRVAGRRFSALAQEPTMVTTLPNSLRVASESTGGETATVGVWIDTGSRYETDQNNGVAHFLEHMAFKGTSKRSQLQLETEVENMGAHLNAYTSREQTVYYAKVLKKDVPKAMDMLSDILLNSTFTEAAVDRERDVILREMEEVESQLEEVVFDRLHEVAFVGTPLARTILGPVENIKSIKSDDIVSYIKANYTAPRMVVAAAGAVDHDELVAMAGDKFGGVPEVAPAGYAMDDAPSLFSGSAVKEYNDDMSELHLAYAFEGLKWTDPDIFALMLCQSLLGTYEKKNAASAALSASPLAAALAKDGVVTSMQPFCTCYNDTGLFGLYLTVPAKADGDALGDMMHHLQEETVKLTTGISDEDLERGKAQLKFNLLQQMDGSSPTAEEIGRQLLTFGRRISLVEMFTRIDDVSSSDVARIADSVIWDQELALAAIGPTTSLKYLGDINSFRRATYWNRL